MRRMVYGIFSVLLVVVLITTVWVNSIHHYQYLTGPASEFHERTVPLNNALSPYLEGNISLRAGSVYYQYHSQIVFYNVSFRILGASPLNFTIEYLTFYTIRAHELAEETQRFVGLVSIDIELRNVTQYSMAGSTRIEIGSVGSLWLGFGLGLTLFDNSPIEFGVFGQLDMLQIFTIPSYFYPTMWNILTIIMVIIGLILLYFIIFRLPPSEPNRDV
jgi:hypothetical protein